MKLGYGLCRSPIVEHAALCRIEFHWVLIEISWFEVWCSNLSMLDLDLLVWIRKNHVEIIDVHDETSSKMYSLQNFMNIYSWVISGWRTRWMWWRTRSRIGFDPYCLAFACAPLFSSHEPIISCHCIKWNAAFHHCCSIITFLPFSDLIPFNSFSFFNFYFILYVDLRKIISHSILVQIMWNFYWNVPHDL